MVWNIIRIDLLSGFGVKAWQLLVVWGPTLTSVSSDGPSLMVLTSANKDKTFHSGSVLIVGA